MFNAAVHMLASQVEPNMSPACLLSALASHGSLQDITLSQVFKAFTTTPLQKKTRNDVLGILAMRHFGGKGGFELMLWNQSVESVPRWLEVTGKILSWFVMMPILSNLHCKFVTWLGFLFQQGTNLWHLLAVTTQKPKHDQTHHEDLLKQTASNSLEAVVGLPSSTSLSNAMGTGRGILNLVERAAKAKLEHRARERLSREACTGTGHMSAITSVEGSKATNQALVFAKQKAPGQQPLWSR